MEVEEIKREYSMRDILARYGIQVNRSGMCCCPIHGEKHPSMKVYKDSFYCFACGAHGDIFSFIQQMDNCDFKTAYLSLGGTYEKQTENERAVTIARRERAKSERERAKQQEEQLRKTLADCLTLLARVIRESSPKSIDDEISDTYCDAVNYNTILTHWWEVLYIENDRKGVNIPNVYRVCKRLERRFATR